MGAIVPTLSQGIGLATSLASTVNTVNSIANTFTGSRNSFSQLEREQDLALRQLQAKQNLQAQQLAADTALERERIALQAEQDEAARRSALKRAVARQRATTGASGISSGDGSAQAVLLGLFEETDTEIAERERLDNLRNVALDQDLSNRRSLNVLQRTQLQERQRLSLAGDNDRFLF